MNWEEAADKLKGAGLHCRLRHRTPSGDEVTEIVGGTEYQTIEMGKLKGMGIFTGKLFHIIEGPITAGQFVCGFDLGQMGPRAEHKGTLAEVVDWLIEQAV